MKKDSTPFFYNRMGEVGVFALGGACEKTKKESCTLLRKDMNGESVI